MSAHGVRSPGHIRIPARCDARVHPERPAPALARRFWRWEYPTRGRPLRASSVGGLRRLNALSAFAVAVLRPAAPRRARTPDRARIGADFSAFQGHVRRQPPKTAAGTKRAGTPRWGAIAIPLDVNSGASASRVCRAPAMARRSWRSLPLAPVSALIFRRSKATFAASRRVRRPSPNVHGTPRGGPIRPAIAAISGGCERYVCRAPGLAPPPSRVIERDRSSPTPTSAGTSRSNRRSPRSSGRRRTCQSSRCLRMRSTSCSRSRRRRAGTRRLARSGARARR